MFYYIYDYLCRKKQVSCKAAAMEMGLSGATAAKWKATGATPHGATLYKVADYFGKPVEFLLGLTPESHLIELEGELAEVSAELDTDPDNFELQCRYDALKEQVEDAKLAVNMMSIKKDPRDMTISEAKEEIYEIATEIAQTPELRALFHAARGKSGNNIMAIADMLEKFKSEGND